MKTIISAITVCLLAPFAFSQRINYEKTFEQARAKALASNKMIFLEITYRALAIQKYVSGLQQPNVAAFYNEHFVSYKLTTPDTTAAKIGKLYPSVLMPAYYFLDATGSPVYMANKATTADNWYLDIAEKAIAQASSGKNLSDYDKQYIRGKFDKQFLNEYIAKRISLGYEDNSKLIEIYIGYLNRDWVNHYKDVLFVLEAGPLLTGNAYNMANSNRIMVDSIYKTEPAYTLAFIYRRTMNNTFNQAVATKDIVMAQKLSAYIKNNNKGDYWNNMMESERNMLSYYKQIKDTANYLREGSYFYDSYYMNFNADPAKKIATVETRAYSNRLIPRDTLTRLNKQAMAHSPAVKPNTPTGITFGYNTPFPTDFSMALNDAAGSFYRTHTHNQQYIGKAIKWSRKAIEMASPNLKPHFYITLAQLLYAQVSYQQAEDAINTAMDINKTNKQTTGTTNYEAMLTKIKNHTL